MGYGKFQTTDFTNLQNMTPAIMASYGAGLQFNPMEKCCLDSLTSRAVFVADVGTGRWRVTASNHQTVMKIRLQAGFFARNALF